MLKKILVLSATISFVFLTSPTYGTWWCCGDNNEEEETSQTLKLSPEKSTRGSGAKSRGEENSFRRLAAATMRADYYVRQQTEETKLLTHNKEEN